MIKFKLYVFLLQLLCFVGFSQTSNYSSYVNPIIGTAGAGHTFPGATLPFGMVQLSPDTRIDDSWEGCSGYHYSDSIIYGFSHTHLSGTGVSDYGDILLMPCLTKPRFINKDYASTFSHSNEKASAGFYKVKLNNGLNVELTTTTRVGLHRYTFPEGKTPHIILDLTHRDKTLDSYIKIIGKRTIEGYRQSQAWANDQRIYFVAEFSEDFDYELFLNDNSCKPPILKNNILNGKNLKAIFSFKKTKKPILVKVAISFVSADGARKNLKKELPYWDFERTKLNAVNAWNKELQKIEVTSDNKNKLTVFYTALYHTMIQPNVAMDVDSMYRGMDKQIHQAHGFTYYTVFSLWDTFRATHPLYTIIDKKRTLDFIKTFLIQYQQNGRLPIWELAGNETNCMIGYHAASVIADAAAKGIINFDKLINPSAEKMLLAMIESANYNQKPEYLNQGFISIDNASESVSKTLEYAYDDWCIAQFAKMIGNNQSVYDEFILRSQNWKNTYDPEIGFMRPKKNGNFLSPFNPREVNNHFTEANSWQYSFFVPHDIYGIVEKMGGAVKFDKKLDQLFSENSKTTGREQADITGLVGQYAHGNEPSHHIAFLYNYIGKAYKTQKLTNYILNEFYKNEPDGLIGNEDCGQMSAWYVLSSIGLYQVCPGDMNLSLTTPQFKKIKFNLEDGSKTIIETENSGEYINEIKFDNQTLKKNFVNFNNLFKTRDKKPSLLKFKLSKLADTTSHIETIMEFKNNSNSNFAITPIISVDKNLFVDSTKIELKTTSQKTEIYYTFGDAKLQNANDLHYRVGKSYKYTKPFYINQTQTISAYAITTFSEHPLNKSVLSGITTAKVYKRPNSWSISYNSKYSSQYNAGGNLGLIDGIYGTENWQKGEWQGYQNQDFECIIDLGEPTHIQTISSNYLQDTRSWILFPKQVEYLISEDGENFKSLGIIQNGIEANDYSIQTRTFSNQNKGKLKSRFVKIKAANFGILPEWHQGKGGQAFIFIDEIEIK